MLDSNFAAALNECVDNNNPQAFAAIVRLEFADSGLYVQGKEKELSNFLEYLKGSFSEEYFRVSINAITDFLLQNQFTKLATQGEFQMSLNSICQSLMVAGGIENKAQVLNELAHGNLSGRNSSRQDLRFEEIPNQRKIVEKRSLLGQLKVLGAWIIWSNVYGVAWDLVLAVVVCGSIMTCTSGNSPLLRSSRIFLTFCTSIAHMSIRMDGKAKKRWEEKYR